MNVYVIRAMNYTAIRSHAKLLVEEFWMIIMEQYYHLPSPKNILRIKSEKIFIFLNFQEKNLFFGQS